MPLTETPFNVKLKAPAAVPEVAVNELELAPTVAVTPELPEIALIAAAFAIALPVPLANETPSEALAPTEYPLIVKPPAVSAVLTVFAVPPLLIVAL